MKNDISLKSLIDIISFGYYSYPIINFLYLNINDISLKYYLLLLKSKWKKDYYLSIDYANKTISTITTTTILRELARFELVSLYNKVGKYDLAKKEINILKNNFDKLPSYARYLMLPGLNLFNKSYNITDNFKVYSDNYIENDLDKAILIYSKARDFIKEKEYSKVYKRFIEGFFLSKNFPHPTMICNGLNGAAWWIREVDKKKALIAADLLEYYIGYYFEDLPKIYNWFDTIFEVKKSNNDITIFEISSIVIKLNKLNKVKIKKQFFHFIPDVSSSTYNITNELKNYILKYVDLKVKKGIINSKSILKIINSKKVSYTSRKPYAIKNELYKIYINKIFKENIIKFKKKNKIKIPDLFLATYSSLIEKPYFTKSRVLKLIFEGDKDKIIKYFSSNYDKMYFFNLMLSEFKVKEVERKIMNSDDFEEIKFNVSPFFVSRKKLIIELFKKVKNFKEFVFHYFELTEEEMRTFDMFLRNCVRYDIKWPIIPKVEGDLKSFALKYNITQKRVALGYYSFEDNERLFLDSIIEKFL